MLNDFSLSDYPDFFDEQPPCSQADPDAFFPSEVFDHNGKLVASNYSNEAGAKKVCRECPLARQCLDYAMKHPELSGIWGGLNENERKKLRRYIEIKTTR